MKQLHPGFGNFLLMLAGIQSLASAKSRLVLPFWHWLIRVVLDKGPLNGCAWYTVTSLSIVGIFNQFLRKAEFVDIFKESGCYFSVLFVW